MNKKEESYEVQKKRDQKKKEKNVFCKLECLFFFLLFFYYSFSFALQRWLLKLGVALQ
jgi:hypothetical protein